MTVDKKSTGYQSGIGYDLPPIGAAEILESCDEQTEFGMPEGLPHDYIGTTPPPERIITVSRRT